MAKLKNVLRKAMGMGIKEISSTFNLSRNTVRRYIKKEIKRPKGGCCGFTKMNYRSNNINQDRV